MGVLEHGENGYRYQSKKQLVQYCLRLLEHPEVQEKMSAAALKRSHRFGDRSFAKRVVKLYRKVAGLPPESETKGTENIVKDAIGK
jgi:glycosyltransferase involved in cell wall biosynthesis